jgi:hypothetical protein
MKLEKILNRNLIIFIFVAIIVGIVIFLTITYERNRTAQKEFESKFNVKQEELEKKTEEEAEVLKGLHPNNVETKVRLNNTTAASIKRVLRNPANSEVMSNGFVKSLYFVRDSSNETTMYNFVTDGSGRVIYYEYSTLSGVKFEDTVEQRNLGEPDFILGTKGDDTTEKIHVYMDEGVSIFESGGDVYSISRFVRMEKEDYLKYFSDGGPLLDLEEGE